MNIRWNEILSNKVFWSGYYAQSEDTLEYPLMWLQHFGLDQTSNVDQEELTRILHEKKGKISIIL